MDFPTAKVMTNAGLTFNHQNIKKDLYFTSMKKTAYSCYYLNICDFVSKPTNRFSITGMQTTK